MFILIVWWHPVFHMKVYSLQLLFGGGEKKSSSSGGQSIVPLANYYEIMIDSESDAYSILIKHDANFRNRFGGFYHVSHLAN